VSLPAGMNSGRGRGFGQANPPRVGVVEPVERGRKPLAKVSARRLAELGEEPYSTFARIDPAQVSDATLKRTPRKLKSKPKEKRPGGREAARAWREACLARNAEEHDGYPVDEVTGERLGDAWQCHHVLEVSHLNAAGLASSEFLLWHPDNGLCVNQRTHERHHSWAARIPFAALRDHHLDFARMLDDTQGTDAWTARLARDYPEGR
jgi:hypothetical protein